MWTVNEISSMELRTKNVNTKVYDWVALLIWGTKEKKIFIWGTLTKKNIFIYFLITVHQRKKIFGRPIRKKRKIIFL